MRAELVFFGKCIDMAARRRRRLLLVVIYAALAALISVLWYFTHWRGTGAYVFWAIMLACRLFFGGYYPSGLVKPFNGKVPHEQPMPSSLLILKLHMYQPVLASDEPNYRNDERELQQRDRAHYLAYQAIGCAVVLQAFFVSMRIAIPRLQNWAPMAADQLYYGLCLVTITLFLTLPQAILLWSEPDMDTES